MAADLPNVKRVEYFMQDNAVPGIETQLFAGLNRSSRKSIIGRTFGAASRPPG